MIQNNVTKTIIYFTIYRTDLNLLRKVKHLSLDQFIGKLLTLHGEKTYDEN